MRSSESRDPTINGLGGTTRVLLSRSERTAEWAERDDETVSTVPLLS